MSRCHKGWEFCDDCANQELEDECSICDDGDNFDPLDFEDAHRALSTFIPIKEAA